MGLRLLKSLLKTAAYPEPTTNVELIQTHVSYIFLTDTCVYKVKKPVDYGFVNFSTLDRRRFYCEEEVRLNSRISPDLYLGVVELRETEHGASFSAGGKIIDYAVKMKRLPANRMLDVLVDQKIVTEAHISRLATVVAKFHTEAETGSEIAKYGSPESIRGNWEECFRLVRNFINITLSSKDFRAIENWVNEFMHSRTPLFEERVAGGFIRDCDGDLHLQNICIEETGRIHIFDCIEFNDRFRYCDTAADIAFLAMDLEYHGRPDLAALFLKEYRASTGDPVSDDLLNFYMCYRAFVRGKVEGLKINDLAIAETEREQARVEAMRHIRLARGYVLRQKMKPALFITCGVTGTGKSSISRALSFELGIPVIRTDAVRKELFADLAKKDDKDAFNEGLYSAEATAATYDRTWREARTILTAGTSVIVDGTFRSHDQRETFRTLAAETGCRFFILRTLCPEKLVKKRLAERIEAKSDISDGRWELFHLQENELETPDPGDAALVDVDTARPPDEAVNAILGSIGILK